VERTAPIGNDTGQGATIRFKGRVKLLVPEAEPKVPSVTAAIVTKTHAARAIVMDDGRIGSGHVGGRIDRCRSVIGRGGFHVAIVWIGHIGRLGDDVGAWRVTAIYIVRPMIISIAR
jgi:hypothetical protein